MVVYIVIAVIVAVAATILKKCKKRKDMAHGIQVFDSNGKLVFDLSNQTTYVLATAHTGTANGSISNSKIVAGKTWVVVTGASSDGLIPVFTVENGKISWDFYMSASVTAVKKKDVTFMYGVF